MRTIIIPLFFVTLTGCGGAKQFPLAETTGTVLCEGQPVTFVSVYFAPVRDGDAVLVGKTGFGMTDENGQFHISTYKPGDGAVIAKHAVRVNKMDSTLPDCPAELSGTKIVQTVEVIAGKNDFAIELPKRKR
ncbi:MAG: hypothetical protein LBH00_10675 [Planctomycetaceae bacterium]|nr:hypothetical protein [Planctomycetaceae bacterium]